MRDKEYLRKVQEAKHRAEKLEVEWNSYVHEMDTLLNAMKSDFDNLLNLSVDFFRDQPDFANKINEQFRPVKKEQ